MYYILYMQTIYKTHQIDPADLPGQRIPFLGKGCARLIAEILSPLI